MMILVSSESKQFIERVASVVGDTFVHCRKMGELSGVLAKAGGPYALIFIHQSDKLNLEELDSVILKSGIVERVKAVRVFFLCDKPLFESSSIIESRWFSGYISADFGDVSDSAGSLGNAIRSYDCDDRVSALLEKGASIRKIALDFSSDKERALGDLREFLSQFKLEKKVVVTAAAGADELLMNALYDAPLDDVGQRVINPGNVNTAVRLAGKKSVAFTVGFDQRHIAISVVDRYGSLDQAELLRCVSKSPGTHSVDPRVLGAGLGLATVFKSGGSLMFFCTPGVRTEAIALFPAAASVAELRSGFRFLMV